MNTTPEPHVTPTGVDPTEYALGDGIRPKRRKNAQARVIRASRRAEAFALRRQGQSYEFIANYFGVSPRTVSTWVEEAIREVPKEEAEALRNLELARLDAVLAPQMRLALAGDGYAVDRVLRIMERRAKYLNLDAAHTAGVQAVGNLLDRLIMGEDAA